VPSDDDGGASASLVRVVSDRGARAPAELPWIGLRGRFLSASYAPKEDDPSFPQVEAHLRRL
jgi:hypothetical protein